MLYLMVFNRTPYQHIKNDMSKQMAIRRGDTINFDGIEDPSLLDCLQVKANLVFFLRNSHNYDTQLCIFSLKCPKLSKVAGFSQGKN